MTNPSEHHDAEADPAAKPPLISERWRHIIAFWVIGLVNNSSYVVMNAGATDIAQGGVGFVYLANVLPSLVIKTTAPYWFDRVPHIVRIGIATGFMILSFFTVALSTELPVKLLGVSFSSAQGGLGEATMLALATTLGDSDVLLTSWSSGTGMAGVFGYLWVVSFHIWGGLTFSQTILFALIFPVIYFISFGAISFPKTVCPTSVSTPLMAESGDDLPGTASATEQRISFASRMRLMRSLWPYTIPLFVVYASEYILQSGVWSAIGFPVTNEKARSEFYSYSNWMYQVGVFFSRSSGTLISISIPMLWALPLMQCVFLAFFYTIAVYQYWYNYSLLVVCFAVGLIGGGVYVNAFKMIAKAVKNRRERELAMSG